MIWSNNTLGVDQSVAEGFGHTPDGCAGVIGQTRQEPEHFLRRAAAAKASEVLKRCCRWSIVDPERDHHPLPADRARIRVTLAEHPEGGELTSFLPPIPAEDEQWSLKMRAAIESTFVAGLELARAGAAEAAQDEAFGTIRLHAAVKGSSAGTSSGVLC